MKRFLSLFTVLGIATMTLLNMGVAVAQTVVTGTSIGSATIQANDAQEQTFTITADNEARDVRIMVKDQLGNAYGYMGWTQEKGYFEHGGDNLGNGLIRLRNNPEDYSFDPLTGLRSWTFRWVAEPDYGRVSFNTISYRIRDVQEDIIYWTQAPGTFAVTAGTTEFSSLVSSSLEKTEVLNNGTDVQRARYTIQLGPQSPTTATPIVETRIIINKDRRDRTEQRGSFQCTPVRCREIGGYGNEYVTFDPSLSSFNYDPVNRLVNVEYAWTINDGTEVGENDIWLYWKEDGRNGYSTDYNRQFTAFDTIELSAPEAPTISAADVISDDSIRVFWDAATSGSPAAQYRLEYMRDGDTTFQEAVDVLDPTDGQHLATGLDADTLYHFRVIAMNAAGESAPSDTMSARTLPEPAPIEVSRDGSFVLRSLTIARPDLETTDDTRQIFTMVVEPRDNNVTLVDARLKINDGAGAYLQWTPAGFRERVANGHTRLLVDESTATFNADGSISLSYVVVFSPTYGTVEDNTVSYRLRSLVGTESSNLTTAGWTTIPQTFDVTVAPSIYSTIESSDLQSSSVVVGETQGMRIRLSVGDQSVGPIREVRIHTDQGPANVGNFSWSQDYGFRAIGGGNEYFQLDTAASSQRMEGTTTVVDYVWRILDGATITTSNIVWVYWIEEGGYTPGWVPTGLTFEIVDGTVTATLIPVEETVVEEVAPEAAPAEATASEEVPAETPAE